MQIETVRKYVLSSLIASVLGLHAFAVAVLGLSQPDKGGSRWGLFVLSVLFSLLGVVAVRLPNRARVLTPWLLLSFVIPVATYVAGYRFFDVS